MDLDEIEKKLADNLEESLNNWDYSRMEIDMNYLEEHIKAYPSKDLERFCKLKNIYCNKMWVGE